MVTLTGTITDPGTLDTFTLNVDWGDGSPVETFSYAAGTTVFSETHQYLDDDPSGTPSDSYAISLTVTDGTTTDTTTVTVNNVEPVLGDLAATTIDENGTTTLTGTITDPGSLDTFTLTVDWGDGSPVETFSYAAGTTVFSETHQYLDDNPSGTESDDYTIALTITDDDTGATTDTATVTVNNVAPVLGDLSATTIDENGVATLTGTVTDPGTLDTFTLEVNWGDGSPVESFSYPAGTVAFGETHQYLDDDPSGTPYDSYTISLKVTDDDTGTTTDTATVTVNNVAPVLGNLSVSSPIYENDVATLTGTITDPGILDTFTLDVDWGDMLSPNNIEQYTFAAGTTSFELTHHYLDDNPSGTEWDDYTIALTITDDDTGASSTSTTVTVNNVAPVITELVSSAPTVGDAGEAEPVTVSALFTDVGTLDTHTATIDWGDGITTAAIITESDGSGSITGVHTYSSGGIYDIEVTLADDDGSSTNHWTTALITGAGVHDRELHVVGTEGNDRVHVSRWWKGHYKVDANFLTDRCHFRTFDGEDFDSIKILLGDGNDHGHILGNTWLPVFMDGGAGDDYLKASSGPAELLGGGGNDKLYGGRGDDVLRGGQGNDYLSGDRGDDQLFGGSGDDKLVGGSGNDELFGRSGDDKLYGGSGNDVLRGGRGNDYLSGDSGDDVLFGGSGDDKLVGGSGNDYLVGGSGDDKLYGGSGNDVLRGGRGNDYLSGSSGNDQLFGGLDDDKLDGGSGNDVGDDKLIGGSGHDILEGGSGNDTLIDWSHKHKYFKGFKKKTIPCASWVHQFVGDLATKDETLNPNGEIKIELPTIDEKKSKSKSKWRR
jgi:Ca2+-binding RTX toxin-like protein